MKKVIIPQPTLSPPASRAGLWLAGLLIVIFLVGCGTESKEAPKPQPETAPKVEPALPVEPTITLSTEPIPQTSLEWFNQGLELAKQGKYDEAIKAYDKALELNPDFAEAWYNKAATYSLKKDQAQTFAWLINATSYNTLLKQKARQDKEFEWLWENNEFKKITGQIPESAPNFVDSLIWHEKGEGLFGQRRYEEALQAFDKALELNPQNVQSWIQKFYILLGYLNRNNEAVRECEKAIGLFPKNDRIWYMYSLALDDTGRYQEALNACNKTIELNPKSDRVWENKGSILAKMKQFDDALKAFEREIELEPTIPWNFVNKIVILEIQSRDKEAIETTKKVKELFPDMTDLRLFNLKHNYLSKYGEYEKAIIAVDKALEIDPDDSTNWYNKGRFLYRLAKADEAIRSFNKATELDPPYGKAWYLKACAYSLKKDKTNMLFSLNKAVNLNVKFKKWAEADKAFESLLNDVEFKKALSQTPEPSTASNINNPNTDKEVDSSEKFTFDLTGATLYFFLIFFAENEGFPIVCKDNQIKKAFIEHTPSVLKVPKIKYNDTIRDIVESTLDKKGYQIIKKESVWKIVKINKTNPQQPDVKRAESTDKKVINPSGNIGNQTKVSLANVQIESILKYVSERENIPILYENNFKKTESLDCIPYEFFAPKDKYDSIIDAILESNLNLIGYKIVKKDLLWEIARIKSAGEDSPPKSEHMPITSDGQRNLDAQTVITLNNIKIGSLLQVISERDGITIIYEDNAVKNLPANIIYSSIKVPADKYDNSMNSILESALKMNDYEIIKKDKIWTVVMNKTAAQTKAIRDAQKWYKTGQELYNKEEYDDALKAFEESLKCDSQDSSVWLSYGNALYFLKKHNEAFKAYDKAIELDPKNPEGWYNRSFIYSLMRNKTNTLNDLAKAISLNVKHKNLAKSDNDFQWLWEDEDFKKLTQ